MAKPVAGINVFQNNTTNALSNLDANFSNIVSAINDPASYKNYGIDMTVMVLTQGGPTSQTVVAQGTSFPSYFYGAQL
jgi:hypothetical protein